MDSRVPSHSTGSQGRYVEPSPQLSHSFCNSFWGEQSNATDLGKLGFSTIMLRMKEGTKSLESTRKFFLERASDEDDYAKKQSRNKINLHSTEVGHLAKALEVITLELKTSAETHSGLAGYIRALSDQVDSFTSRREGSRKNQQLTIERSRDDLMKYEAAVEKARTKYQSECIKINELKARASLLLGPALDKVIGELSSLESSVDGSKAKYQSHVKLLVDTTSKWVLLWKSYCDFCQDQEEERLEFIKNRFWDYSNAFSTGALSADESAERSRIALEQCLPSRDLILFVESKGTGNEIPDAPPCEDFTFRGPPPKRNWKTANFVRSSVRIGVKNEPSTVEAVTSAISTSRSSRSIAPERRQSVEAGLASITNIQSRQTTNPVPVASPIRSSTSPRKELSGLSALENAMASPRSSGTMSRASLDQRTPEPTRAAIRPTLETSLESLTLSSTKTRADPAPQTPAKIARVDEEEDDDDPIARALATAPSRSPQPRTRQLSNNSRSATSGELISRPTSTGRAPSQMRSVTETNLAAADYRSGRSEQSRSTSPGPTSDSRYRAPSPSASMMQAPAANQVPGAVSSYGQALPGERERRNSSTQQDPRLRHQSMPAANNNRYSSTNLASPGPAPGPDPYARSSSPTPFAGIGARGRSPSPQPFNPPRASSPAMLNSRPSSYSNPPGNYGAPPPRSPSPYGQPINNNPPANYRNSISQSPAPRNDGRQPQTLHGVSSHSSMRNSMSFPSGAPPPVEISRHAPGPNYATSPSRSQYQEPSQPQRQQPSQTNQGYQYQDGLNPNLGIRSHSPGSSYASSSVYSPAVSNGNYAPAAIPQNYSTARTTSTGYTASGERILHYVRALYDYAATGAEYFSFEEGDIIAVTATAADGWWQGEKVSYPGHSGSTFPSNFTESA